MTRTEINEANELLARFENKSFQMSCASDYKDKLPNGILRKLKYHRDWNDLIRIVSLINDICTKKSNEINKKQWKDVVYENPLDNPLCWRSWSYHYIVLSTRIESIYKMAINSIKFINNSRP